MQKFVDRYTPDTLYYSLSVESFFCPHLKIQLVQTQCTFESKSHVSDCDGCFTGYRLVFSVEEKQERKRCWQAHKTNGSALLRSNCCFDSSEINSIFLTDQSFVPPALIYCFRSNLNAKTHDRYTPDTLYCFFRRLCRECFWPHLKIQPVQTQCTYESTASHVSDFDGCFTGYSWSSREERQTKSIRKINTW